MKDINPIPVVSELSGLHTALAEKEPRRGTIIVVPGCSVKIFGKDLTQRRRIRAALKVAGTLSADTRQRVSIFVTGSSAKGDTSRASVYLRKQAEIMGLAGKIEIRYEHQSKKTTDHGPRLVEWMQQQGEHIQDHNWVLVTNTSHMSRAAQSLEDAEFPAAQVVGFEARANMKSGELFDATHMGLYEVVRKAVYGAKALLPRARR